MSPTTDHLVLWQSDIATNHLLWHFYHTTMYWSKTSVKCSDIVANFLPFPKSVAWRPCKRNVRFLGLANGQNPWNSKVPPRFELGSQDSKSWVLTITPWDRTWCTSCFALQKHAPVRDTAFFSNSLVLCPFSFGGFNIRRSHRKVTSLTPIHLQGDPSPGEPGLG